MAPLAPRPGHRLLRCPICRSDLAAAAGALACRNRHSFDLAREGYVNLLRSVGHRSVARGDSPEQLRHRTSFLDSGHFDGIATTIARHLQQAAGKPEGGCWHVLDAGSGTGHHLSQLAAALNAPVIGLGLDISKAAARHAARRWPRLAFAVADLWGEWPVHNGTADLVLGFFAPKNFAETARVLRPGGWLTVVYPGPNHLIELKHRFGLMHQHAHKGRRYMQAASRLIGPPRLTRLVRSTLLDGGTVRDVVLMGPNAHHASPLAIAAEMEPLTVTFDLVVLFACKAAASPLEPSGPPAKL